MQQLGWQAPPSILDCLGDPQPEPHKAQPILDAEAPLHTAWAAAGRQQLAQLQLQL